MNTALAVDRERDAIVRRLRALLAGRCPAVRTLAPDRELGAALGLDSLERLELLARVEREFQVRLPDAELGDELGLSSLAEKIRLAPHRELPR